MPVFSKTALEQRSKFFRYIHFLITGVRLQSYGRWKAKGEPNPFVAPDYRRPKSRQVQVSEMLIEFRGAPSHDPI